MGYAPKRLDESRPNNTERDLTVSSGTLVPVNVPVASTRLGVRGIYAIDLDGHHIGLFHDDLAR